MIDFDTSEFDFPVFKRLASNDTGGAPGHQGGVVIPKDLSNYFPDIEGDTTALRPTRDRLITAELIFNGERRAVVRTRYQIQTWGGTRSPERRITGNIGALRNNARDGDYLLFQRSLVEDDSYRFILISQGTPEYDVLANSLGNRRWGPVDRAISPVTNGEIRIALAAEMEKESQPFSMFDEEERRVEVRSQQVARSKAFRENVLRIYDYRCCVTGECLITPTGKREVEAAHIVPRRLRGADDVRNGLALTKRLHWAFDNGLFGIDGNRTIVVPDDVRAIPDNTPLAELKGNNIVEANIPNLRAEPDALAWHLENIVRRRLDGN